MTPFLVSLPRGPHAEPADSGGRALRQALGYIAADAPGTRRVFAAEWQVPQRLVLLPRLFRANASLPRERAPFRMLAPHPRGKLLGRATADLVAALG